MGSTNSSEASDSGEDASSEQGGDEQAQPNKSRSRSRSRKRSRSRGRRRKEPVRLEEVDRFLDENRINDEAAEKIRALSPASQRRIIARPLTGTVQNASKVMIARAERPKAGESWSGWNSAMMGATPAAISKFIKDSDLDDSASRLLRGLPPHQQAMALRWNLSRFANPSAKFMSMANSLSTSGTFPGMMQMPGMPMMPMGMPPMGMPMGMPGMMMPGQPVMMPGRGR